MSPARRCVLRMLGLLSIVSFAVLSGAGLGVGGVAIAAPSAPSTLSAADAEGAARVDGVDRAESLRGAARRGDVEVVARLLGEGVDVNAADAVGTTALHLAASEGQTAVARILIAGGAHVDQAEYDGDTPLVNASVFGHAEIVELLLQNGADPEVESSQGYKPIQHARRERHSLVVRLLRDASRAASRNPGASSRSVVPPPPRRSAGLDRNPSAFVEQAKNYRPGYARRVAAVIGVNDYQHWPRLRGAQPDARKMAARLRELGFDEVLELYDREATRGAILGLLGGELKRRVGENDLVVIFFAGHGQTETIEGGRKRGYIIPVDATVEGVFATAIPMQKLRELTDRLPAKHVYYAMDSCYSGLGFTRGVSIVEPGADDYFGKITSLRAVQMVAAGGEGEEAVERGGEGVFTRSLLDALEGRADANGDGFVTASEIGAYVSPRVTNETGARQTPQAGRLEGEGEIAFELPRRR